MPVSDTERTTRPFSDAALTAMLAPCGCIAHGVVQQVLQHFLQAQDISHDFRQVRRDFRLQGQVSGGGVQPKHFDAGIHDLRDGHRAQLRLEFARFNPGELEQVIGQARQASGIAPNDLDETHPVLLVVNGPGQERLGKSLYGGERGLEFMRNVGDKIPPRAFQAPQLADIMQNDHGAADGILRANGRRGDGKAAQTQSSHDQLGPDAFAPFQSLLYGIEQVRLADDLDNRSSFRDARSQLPGLDGRLRCRKPASGWIR